MMTKLNDQRPALRLPGQNKDNPLLALLNGVTPKQVQEIDDEIAVTQAYLDKLTKLRDVVGDAPVATSVAVTAILDAEVPEVLGPNRSQDAYPPQPKAIAAPKPEPEYLPPRKPLVLDDDEPPVRPGEGVLGGDEEEDEEDEASVPEPKPRVNRDADVQWKDLDKKRRTVAEYIFKKGFAQQRKIVSDCNGIGGRNIAAVMDHKWFERFKVGGEEVWRLTPQGKQEGVEL